MGGKREGMSLAGDWDENGEVGGGKPWFFFWGGGFKGVGTWAVKGCGRRQ